MTEPVFSAAAEDLWSSLPQVYRDEDANQLIPAAGWPMKRWISATADQVNDVLDLVDRLDYEPVDSREDDSQSTSELVDPALADAAWLPWLAQALGVRPNPSWDEATMRANIAGATSGFRGGTKAAIAAAVPPLLTGEKYVHVLDHSILNEGDGGEWDVLIITRDTETLVTSEELIAAVIAADAKPAGVELHHATFATTWGDVESALPTWSHWNDKTWQQIEETGI